MGNINFLRNKVGVGRSRWGSIPGYGIYVDMSTKSLPTSKKKTTNTNIIWGITIGSEICAGSVSEIKV